MEVVIGVVFRKVCEAVQTDPVHVLQAQAQEFLQNLVHLVRGTLDEVHLRDMTAIACVCYGLTLFLGTVSKFFGSVIDSVIEELIEVNFPVVFRGLHGQEQKLVEVEAAAVVVLVEGLMVEDVQLLRCQRLGLRRLRSFGFARGTGAGQGGQSDD